MEDQEEQVIAIVDISGWDASVPELYREVQCDRTPGDGGVGLSPNPGS